MMISGGYLHGVQLMPLHVVEDDETFLVGSFQGMGIAQMIVHPNGKLGFRESVVDLNL
jgi:hypothetical protein